MNTNKYSDATFGIAEAVFNKLGGMEGVQRFLRAESEVVIKQHLINLDADPFVPKGWKVEEHIKGGQFPFNPTKIRLYLSSGQKNYKRIGGHKLRDELKNQPVLNANVLDYLLANPHLIPEEWKGEYVFFWGTIYHSADGGLCVRCMCRLGGRWDWSCLWLGDDWVGLLPVAISQV